MFIQKEISVEQCSVFFNVYDAFIAGDIFEASRFEDMNITGFSKINWNLLNPYPC